jgi:hypothetical protein
LAGFWWETEGPSKMASEAKKIQPKAQIRNLNLPYP